MNDRQSASQAPLPRDGDFARLAGTRSVVASARRASGLAEERLVLRARGVPHAVIQDRGRRLLVVPVREALRAQEELEAYARENVQRGEVRPPARAVTRGFSGAIGYASLLVACHLRFGPEREAGLVDGARVADGEYFRIVTALTLHADAGHLASNVVFGALFGLLAAQQVGNGVAWLAILGAGALGNAINVALRAEAHRALGASTAVFAALGLLVALALRWRRHQDTPGRLRRWAPLFAGLGLLGWLGTAGERTDIPAHLHGLLAGILVGLPLRGLTGDSPARPAIQLACAVAAVTIIAGCWVLALRAQALA